MSLCYFIKVLIISIHWLQCNIYSSNVLVPTCVLIKTNLTNLESYSTVIASSTVKYKQLDIQSPVAIGRNGCLGQDAKILEWKGRV